MQTTKTIYLVKKFGAHTGYTNIKTFTREADAQSLAIRMICNIPIVAIQNGDESVEVEAIELVEDRV